MTDHPSPILTSRRLVSGPSTAISISTRPDFPHQAIACRLASPNHVSVIPATPMPTTLATPMAAHADCPILGISTRADDPTLYDTSRLPKPPSSPDHTGRRSKPPSSPDQATIHLATRPSRTDDPSRDVTSRHQATIHHATCLITRPLSPHHPRIDVPADLPDLTSPARDDDPRQSKCEP